MKTPAEEEGPRSFAVFLRNLANGESQAEISKELHELCQVMQAEAKAQRVPVKGELKLTFRFTVTENSEAVVGYDVTTKRPTPKRSGGFMWLTAGANLTPQNPRQTELPLREVSGPRGEARDVEDEQDAREV